MSARPAAMILVPSPISSALLGAERYEPWWLRASRRPGRLRAPGSILKQQHDRAVPSHSISCRPGHADAGPCAPLAMLGAHRPQPDRHRRAAGFSTRRQAATCFTSRRREIQAMPEYRLVRFRGKFAVTWNEGGRRFRHSLGVDSRAEAEQRLARFVAAQAAAGAVAKGNHYTIADAWAGYAKALGGKPSAVTTRHQWKAISPYFADRNASTLTEESYAGKSVTA